MSSINILNALLALVHLLPSAKSPPPPSLSLPRALDSSPTNVVPSHPSPVDAASSPSIPLPSTPPHPLLSRRRRPLSSFSRRRPLPPLSRRCHPRTTRSNSKERQHASVFWARRAHEAQPPAVTCEPLGDTTVDKPRPPTGIAADDMRASQGYNVQRNENLPRAWRLTLKSCSTSLGGARLTMVV
jgi:hypothetical protein